MDLPLSLPPGTELSPPGFQSGFLIALRISPFNQSFAQSLYPIASLLGSQTATTWNCSLASNGNNSLMPWVPTPMYATVILSLGAT